MACLQAVRALSQQLPIVGVTHIIGSEKPGETGNSNQDCQRKEQTVGHPSIPLGHEPLIRWQAGFYWNYRHFELPP
jgi:hypothetical protein